MLGRKGEREGQRRNIYLRHVLHDMLKDGKKKSGQSMSQIIEWCVCHSFKDWREQFLDEDELAKKKREELMDMEEAYRLGHREYARYCERTSEERYMRHILFGDLDLEKGKVRAIENFENWLNYDPDSLWQKLKGKFSRRDDGWVERGWEPTGQ